MPSRRTFLNYAAIALPLAGCASIPKDLTRRDGGAGDAAAKAPEPWRPSTPGPEAAPSAEPGAMGASGPYVCPMHPEITMPSPGVCPKCSMKLVRVKEGGSR